MMQPRFERRAQQLGARRCSSSRAFAPGSTSCACAARSARPTRSWPTGGKRCSRPNDDERRDLLEGVREPRGAAPGASAGAARPRRRDRGDAGRRRSSHDVADDGDVAERRHAATTAAPRPARRRRASAAGAGARPSGAARHADADRWRSAAPMRRPPRRAPSSASAANLGDRAGDARRAPSPRSPRCPRTTLSRRSSLLRSAPVDAPAGRTTSTRSRTLRTALAPLDAAARAAGASKRAHGRERPYRNAPRTLDLDLLLHGDRSWRATS